MKLFNVENGIEKVYIQQEDLTSLKDYYGPIPDTLIQIDNNGDQYDFISIDRPAEIQFIKDAYWIINLDEINLSEEELIKNGESIAQEMNLIAVKHNHETDETAKSKYMSKHKLLNHKMKSYANLLLIKRGQLTMHLPSINKGNELIYDDIGFEAYTSINPLIVTIKRKDNNAFNSIPFDFVNKVMEIMKEKNKYTTECKYSTTLSPDKKSVIVTIMFDKMIKVDTKHIVAQPINNITINNRKYITSNAEILEPNNFMKMVQYIFKKH